MSQPPPYNRLSNFTDYALAHPAAPYNPSDHDAELNAIETTVDALCTNIALIQRDDGELANDTVGPDQLTSAVRSLIAIGEDAKVEPWATGHTYNPGDAVSFGVDAYLCVIQHVAGVFNTDLTLGKWVLIGLSTLSVVANASLVTFTPTGTIAATNVQAAIVEASNEALAAAATASADAASKIPLAQKGAANGVATLDAGTKVPVAQLPDLSGTYVPLTQKAAANGVATLDAAVKVPVAQLPDLSGLYLPPAVAAATYIPLTQRGAPNGVATLDAGGIVPIALLPWGGSRLRGVSGFQPGVAPTTRMTIGAIEIVLQHFTRAQASIALFSPPNVTNDITLAGPIANGRDQAAAFAINTACHFYYIYNPTTLTLASISSANGPGIGPAALPTDYTHWAYVTTLLLNGAGVMPGITSLREGWVNLTAPVQTLTAGVAAAFTSAPFTGLPGVEYRYDIRVRILATGITVANEDSLQLSYDGVNTHAVVPVVGNTAFSTSGHERLIVPNGNLRYSVTKLSTGGTTSADIWVVAYQTSNGAS